MSDPLAAARGELEGALALAAREASAYLARLPDQPVAPPGAEDAIGEWADPMPEEGSGAIAALEELAGRADAAATRSSGPRFFHFVMERLAEVPLNIVCFRARPPGVPEEELDELNRRLGAALLHDGRVFAGTTSYDGKVAFRPAIVNWQTGPEDVDLLVDVLLELLPGK